MPDSNHTRAGRRQEDAHLAEIERLTRELLAYVDTHSRRHFAPGTLTFVDHVRPVVDQLDHVRARARPRRGRERRHR